VTEHVCCLLTLFANAAICVKIEHDGLPHVSHLDVGCIASVHGL